MLCNTDTTGLRNAVLSNHSAYMSHDNGFITDKATKKLYEIIDSIKNLTRYEIKQKISRTFNT